LVKVTDTGQVIYKAEKQSCRAFPDPNGDGITSGPKRNFQILSPLDFLAEFTQHIPLKGAHLIRYYGYYSNKSRGVRKKAESQQAEEAVKPSSGDDASGAALSGCSKTWANGGRGSWINQPRNFVLADNIFRGKVRMIEPATACTNVTIRGNIGAESQKK